MPTFYDSHCHVFNKDLLVRQLVNVVQALAGILEERDAGQAEGIIRRLKEVLKIANSQTSEEVYDKMIASYTDNMIVTPLMLDLTYAADNDGVDNEDVRYKKRVKSILRAIELLLPIVKRFIKAQDLKKFLDDIKSDIKEIRKSIKVWSPQELELLNKANYEQQLADLRFLSEKHENIKPFYNIDPRQEYKKGVNVLANIKDQITSSHARFIGVKLYTNVGYSPTDPVLMGKQGKMGVYSFCEKNNIPITIHCSNAGFACLSTDLHVQGHTYSNGVVNHHGKDGAKIRFNFKFVSKKVGEAIKERASVLNHPELWKIVLKKYPDLRLNFAHFGGSDQIMAYTRYELPKSYLVEEFEDELQNIPSSARIVMRAAYKKKGTKVVLSEILTIDERAQVWNISYHFKMMENWSKAIFDIIKDPKYPNAYTDLSAFTNGEYINDPETPSNEKVLSIRRNLREFKINVYDKLNDYEKSKFLYGSDYFLLEFWGPVLRQYIKDFKAAFEDDFEQIASINPERFLGLTIV